MKQEDPRAGCELRCSLCGCVEPVTGLESPAAYQSGVQNDDAWLAVRLEIKRISMDRATGGAAGSLQ